jgi:hypothetical protein
MYNIGFLIMFVKLRYNSERHSLSSNLLRFQYLVMLEINLYVIYTSDVGRKQSSLQKAKWFVI